MASKTMYELEILLGAKKASSFSRNINDAKSSIGSITSAAKKVGVAATAGLAVAGAGAAAAMNTFQNFEQEMANTAAIAGASEFEYQKMEKAARDAGKSTTKTAKGSAAALGYMSLAGWDVNQSTSALVPVLKLSESTHMELATTSDLVTDSMSALGLKTSELSEYLDIVAQENNSANTSSEQLMQAYIRTGGAARTLGADLLDTSTAIGVLADNGTKGEKAGTAMNAMLTRIASNDAARKQLKKLNVSIFDSKGEFIGLEESLIKINTALDGMSTEKQSQALKDIAGTEYYNNMAYLLDAVETGADGAESAWDSLESELASSDGALEKMNDRVTDTAEGALARMNSALDDMKISLADSFDGEYVYVLDSLAETFNNASESIADFAQEHEVEIHQFVTSVTEGIETVVDVGSNAVAWLVENSDMVSSVMAGMGAAFVGTKAAEGAKGLVGAFGHLQDVFQAISNSPGKAGEVITSFGSGAKTAKTAVDALTDSVGKGNSVDLSQSFSFQSVWPKNSIIESNNSIVESVKTVGKVAGDVTDDVDAAWEELKLLTKGAEAMGEAAGGSASKLTKLGGSASKLTSLISPVTIAIAGAVALGAAITGLAVYHAQAKKKMVKANLEEHFGNLSVSLETLDETAQNIVGKRQLTQIADMMESIADTDAAVEAMADSMNNVKEIRWKMSAGIELDQDDKETYQRSIEEYVNQAQEAVESKGYTVSIATDLLLGKNSDIGVENDAFFSGLDDELDRLEQELNDAVKSGVHIDTSATVQELLGQISEITNAVTEAENEASLQAIQLEYSGKDLTPADFKQLSTDISKYEKDVIDGAKEAYEASMTALNARRNKGDITQTEYDAEKAEYDAGFYNTQAEAVGNGADYILRTIEDAYPKISGKMEGIQQAISSGLNDALAKGVTGDSVDDVIDSVIDEAMAKNGVTDKGTIGAINDLFKSGLGDTFNQMDILKGQMQEKGVAIPEEFEKSFRNVESLSAITGDMKSALVLTGETISDSPEHAALVSTANEMGQQVDEAVMQGIDDLEPKVQGAVKNLIASIQSVTNGKFELNGTVTLNSSIAADAINAAGNSQKTEESNKTTGAVEKRGLNKKTLSPKKIRKNASGGIYDSPILTSFAELGPEAAIPLDGSDRAKSLWSATGEILGMRPQEDTHVYRTVKTATRDQELYARTVQATAGMPGTGAGAGAAITTGIATGQDGCHISYSPKIVIQGNADAAVVSSALEMSQSKFEEMMNTYMANQKRFSFRAK